MESRHSNLHQFHTFNTTWTPESWIFAPVLIMTRGGYFKAYRKWPPGVCTRAKHCGWMRLFKDQILVTLEILSTHNWTLETRRHYKDSWIGLNDLSYEGKYGWSDKSPLAFTKWADKEPNDYYGQEDCVELSRWSTKWNDQHCEQNRPFVCKKHNSKHVWSGPISIYWGIRLRFDSIVTILAILGF